MSLVLLLLLSAFVASAAEPPVYILLWFDTEDYITPQDDEACLRLANDLTARGVRATFKIVGEKARVLETRKRTDVIKALKKHEIAYHSENHSIPPAPAVYLRKLGMIEGAEEFYRREGPGARDVQRIFGVTKLATYGQPGSSWGPQSHAALRKLGIPTYVDEGQHVGINSQPFWYGGLLYAFNLAPYTIRIDINDESKSEAAIAKARSLAQELQKKGGGVMHFWYHPNEFVTTEFWDGVNFSRGANPPRDQWKPATLRTKDDSERCYRILNTYVDQLKAIPGARFVTTMDLLNLYEPPATTAPDMKRAKQLLGESITWHDRWSAAELAAAALQAPTSGVGAPSARRESTYRGAAISRANFERALRDAQNFIRTEGRLPVEVWIGDDTLSIGDFVATAIQDSGANASIPVQRGRLAFETHVATDPCRNFNWVIHPEGFCAPELYDLGKIEAWTLKPARFKVIK
jgi:hypothetical protein